MADNKFKRTEYYLYTYKDTEALNETDQARIDKLMNDVSVRAIGYTEKSTPTNQFNSDVENEVIKRDEHNSELIEQIKLEIAERNFNKRIIEGMLKTLDPEEKKLVELRYFSNPRKGWIEIGAILNMDRISCMRMRNKVISKFSDKL